MLLLLMPFFVITRRYLRVASCFSYVAVAPSLRYIAVAPGGNWPTMPRILPDLPAIAPEQAQTIAIDFGKLLPSGVTLTGTPTLNVSTAAAGAAHDPSPASRVSVGPMIGAVPVALGGTSFANAAVLAQFSNCIPNAVYVIEVVCQRSDGDKVEAYVHMPCAAPQ